MVVVERNNRNLVVVVVERNNRNLVAVVVERKQQKCGDGGTTELSEKMQYGRKQ